MQLIGPPEVRPPLDMVRSGPTLGRRRSPQDQSRLLAQALYKWASNTNDGVDMMIFTRDADLCSGAVHAQNQSPLFALPVELLLCIGTFLTRIDITCWSLTCKRFASVIGMKTWTKLNGRTLVWEDFQSWGFLPRLETDDPDTHLCFHLHKLRKNSLCVSPRKPDEPYMCSPASIWRIPNFCEVRLVMLRHFHKGSGDSVGLPLSHLAAHQPWESKHDFGSIRETWSRSAYWNIPYYSTVTVVPYIVEDEFQLHVTLGTLISTREARWLATTNMARRQSTRRPMFLDNIPLYRSLFRSGHVDPDSANVTETLKAALDGRPPPLDAMGGNFSTYCPTCMTQSKFIAIQHGAAGLELIVQFWQNLGRARHAYDVGWHDYYLTANNETYLKKCRDSGLRHRYRPPYKGPKYTAESRAHEDLLQLATERWRSFASSRKGIDEYS